MMTRNTRKKLSLLASGITGLMSAHSAHGVNLNYEGLSFFEEPLATEVGDVTLELEGLLDAPYVYNTESEEGDLGLNTLFQIKAETQLDNSVTVGAAYLGNYDSEVDDDYEGNFALFARNIWGTVSLGDVTGMVREETRRLRGTGNAELEYDDFIGTLDSQGLAYVGRYGPSKISVTADEDGQFGLGWVFQRPIGNKDYRLSLRYQDSEYVADDGLVFESRGLQGVAELTYGSNVVDIGLAAEQLESTSGTVDRWFLSLGARRKHEAFTLSAEAHFGELENQRENSLSLGLRYDIARGLSLNLGVNIRDSEVDLAGFESLTLDDTQVIASLRYGF